MDARGWLDGFLDVHPWITVGVVGVVVVLAMIYLWRRRR